MADSLLADYILESTGYLSALSKTLPAIYPLQGKIQIYRLSILQKKYKSTGYPSSISEKHKSTGYSSCLENWNHPSKFMLIA
jgi:hypothetical protein